MQTPFMELYSKEVIEANFSYDALLKTLLHSAIRYSEEIVSKRMTLIDEHISSKYVYFIKSGIVMLQRNGSVTQFVGSKKIIGLDNNLLLDGSRYTAEVIQTVEAYVFDYEEVLQTLIGMQEGWIFLYLNNRNNETFIRNRYLLMREVGSERLMSVLGEIADTFGIREGSLVRIPSCFTRRIIGNYANMAYKSLSRTINTLELEGFLLQEGKQISLLR